MATIDINGYGIEYHEQGNGEPLVLVHGSASDARTWNPQRDAFAERHRVITYSRRYHWPNEPIPEGRDYSMNEQVDDLQELLRSLDIAPTHLIGHSYGAFMTGNLLAHSDLFRAGIARSGASNRTLTPFGFQAEERLFWEAPEIYFTMSPFMHADKVDEPILLIHGEADNNSGTYPMQSERFYNALKGLGATARLVMLPHESHGYRARESLLHMLWEEHRWLETYVKNASPRDEADVEVEGPTGR